MAKFKGKAQVEKKNAVLKALDVQYITHDRIVHAALAQTKGETDE